MQIPVADCVQMSLSKKRTTMYSMTIMFQIKNFSQLRFCSRIYLYGPCPLKSIKVHLLLNLVEQILFQIFSEFFFPHLKLGLCVMIG